MRHTELSSVAAMLPTPLTNWRTIQNPRTTSAGMATTWLPSRTFTRDCGTSGYKRRAPRRSHRKPRHPVRPIPGRRHIARSRGDAGQQVKNEKFQVPELILDIIAKDPQIKHVAEQMQPAAMHEHGCENRYRVCLRIA